MNKFKFTVDSKVITWRRDKVIILADSLEEALDMAESGEYEETLDTEYLNDTEIFLRPEENDGFMTCEVFDSSGNSIWNNGNV